MNSQYKMLDKPFNESNFLYEVRKLRSMKTKLNVISFNLKE